MSLAELLPFPAIVASRPTRHYPEQTFPDPVNDDEARSTALDIAHSWIVEAPAGSGKTGLLIQRYLKLLSSEGVQRPEDVLVLTFTRKADGELRSRVLEELAAARDGGALPEDAKPFEKQTRALALDVLAHDRKLRWNIQSSPSRLNIRTIDSFCAEVARSMPLLAGAARQEPQDDASPLYELAARRTVAELGGPDPILTDALGKLLRLRDVQVKDCVSLLVEMLAQREQWAELIPLSEEELTEEFLDATVRGRLERSLDVVVTTGLSRAAAALGDGHVAELTHFARNLSVEAGYKAEPNPLAVFLGISGDLRPCSDQLTAWRAAANLVLKSDGGWRSKVRACDVKVDLPKLNVKALENFVDELRFREQHVPDLREALSAVCKLPEPRYPDDQWTAVKALCRVLRRALAELHVVFAQQGRCDFAEVAVLARNLVCASDGSEAAPDPSAIQAARITHLLVDEMQDTSSSQYRLLEGLTRMWDAHSQTIFLVGDPKQSIYAFRQARVERFLRTMETGTFGEHSLGALRLTRNFRSQGHLVDAFNETFLPIFPAETLARNSARAAFTADVRVPFVLATPTRAGTLPDPLQWHVLDSTPEHPGAASTDVLHARQIRDIIEDFLTSWPNQRPEARAPRIAVLARNRNHLAPVIAEFQRSRDGRTLPFRAVDVESLRERPEVLDLVALTRALLRPTDRVAWLAVLRSPLCGLTLSDLLALTGDGSSNDRHATTQELVASRAKLLSSDGQRQLECAWGSLQQAVDTLGRDPLSTQVERTWRTLGGDAPLLPEERRNAFRYLDLLRRLEDEHDPISWPVLERKLQKLYAEPSGTPTPVELMTIHKAKGLEWDLVLVPALEKGSGQNAHGLLKWLEEDDPASDGGFILAPIHTKGGDISALSSWMNREETKRQAEEAARLFYVACTRAREALHLFVTVERKTDGTLCKPRASESLLHAAWPAAQSILERQLMADKDRSAVLAFPSPEKPETLALAAAGAEVPEMDGPETPNARTCSSMGASRLPSDFDPQARLDSRNGAGLPYATSANLPQSVVFARPEGSFAARAFGNTVHRFLELLSQKLAQNGELKELQEEVASWLPRFVAILRSEGLPTALAGQEARRAVLALQATLEDPTGRWLLGPRKAARNEVSFSSPEPGRGTLRADRVFLAGPDVLGTLAADFLWIVDYKTAEPGEKPLDLFLAEQKAKYLPQMATYAQAAEAAGTAREQIRLALYFPLVPTLVTWSAAESDAG